MTVGKLNLTEVEENQLVAFLQTLTDGFTTPYPDINTFTGACMAGGAERSSSLALRCGRALIESRQALPEHGAQMPS